MSITVDTPKVNPENRSNIKLEITKTGSQSAISSVCIEATMTKAGNRSNPVERNTLDKFSNKKIIAKQIIYLIIVI